jgi:hypothetical protein
MLDPQNEYFPDFDDDSINSFARPFCRLMVAYANLDREIARLVSASTGKPRHADTFRRGSASGLGQQVEKFIRKHNGDVTEISAIKEHLSGSQKPSLPKLSKEELQRLRRRRQAAIRDHARRGKAVSVSRRAASP